MIQAAWSRLGVDIISFMLSFQVEYLKYSRLKYIDVYIWNSIEWSEP